MCSWDKEDYFKDSYIREDGTYVIMGRHIDFVAKHEPFESEEELNKWINNSICNRFALNRAYYIV